MESQLNVFNKGLKSDLSPAYVDNQSWVFPTVNARFFNNGRGFAATNLHGNTNKDMPETEGAEIALKENFILIGAYEKEGIAFLFSVDIYHDEMEIGTFPSPTTAINTNATGGYTREYSPLRNIKTADFCRLTNSETFSWSPDHLLRIEGKVEYDGSVNLYICSGTDLLRVVNSGFDVLTGVQLEHRYYNRNDFEEATKIVKTQSKAVSYFTLDRNKIRVLKEGGTLPNGLFIFYGRFISDTYDTTKWLIETPAIPIGNNTYDDNTSDYISGAYESPTTSTQQSIEIDIPVSTAYTHVEIGYIFRSFSFTDSSSPIESINSKGILANPYKIEEGSKSMTIKITTIENSSDWDEKENLQSIELIPKDILAMNDILFQYNMSNETIDIHLLRDFIKRVKVKCHVHHGKLPMPTDEIFLKNTPGSTEGIFSLAGIYLLTKTKADGSTYEKYYSLLNHDYYITHSPTDNKTGSMRIKSSAPFNLNGDYSYANKIASSVGFINGYKYEFDELEYAEFIGLSLFGSQDEKSFLLKDTLTNQETFISTNVYDKFYSATSANLKEGDIIMLVDDYKLYIKIDGIIDKEFFYFNEIIDRFNQSYMLFDISLGVMTTNTLTIDHEEITLSYGGVTYVFGKNSEMFIQNDGYYSKRDHVMSDVGYFGGEIYAFSMMAQDIYGNTFGAFPVTGIDHYYANKKDDLDYNAYDPNSSYEMLLPDEESSYSVEGNRKFIKNQEGIYRFPSRSNYVKKTDANGVLIKEERYLQPTSDITDYDDDIFNLTQRILDGVDSRTQTNVINIFKVSFDFTEAYNWLAKVDNGGNEKDQTLVRMFRQKIVKFIPMRAKRTAEADNLIAQGIIQKPNTIVPFPKYHELTYEHMGEGEQGSLSQSSYEQLISYNFECIQSFTGLGTKTTKIADLNNEAMVGYSKLHLCRGQLGNSAIKMESDVMYGDNDTLYPKEYTTFKNLYGNPLFNKKAFIYSGTLSAGKIDFLWDAYQVRGGIFQYKTNSFKMPPALGAMTYPVLVNNAEGVYYSSYVDAVWGELGSIIPQGIQLDGEVAMRLLQFPMQNIYFNGMYPKSSTYTPIWYDYTSNIIELSEGEKAQYLDIGNRPVKLQGAGLKIPFFKGYMPCVTRADRRCKEDNNQLTKYFTQRCMYHSYDRTRAFFSPDIIFNERAGDVSTDIGFMKPIRKTLYSGLEGMTNYGIEFFNVAEESFKADAWKTFLARINVMPFRIKPFQGDDIDDYNATNKDMDAKIQDQPEWKNLADFYKAAFIEDSGIRTNTNPLSMLHSVRKYYKVESQRECVPVGSNKFIGSMSPAHVDLGDTSDGNLNLRSHVKDRTDVYLNWAYDFTLNHSASEYIVLDPSKTNQKSSKYSSKSKDAFDAYKTSATKKYMLFGAIDVLDGGMTRGNFITSNRTFSMSPYYAIGLDVDSYSYIPSKEYDSLDYPTTSYRHGKDYTGNIEDRYVKLSRIKGNQKLKYLIDKNNSEFSSMDDSHRIPLANQIEPIDVYVDTNYEDLSLVNLYKKNPENIVDITAFYNYSSEEYFAIGEVLASDVIGKSNGDNPNRTIVAGKGDCYLDRVYFKHTSWFHSNLVPHTADYTNGGKPHNVGLNWEEVGAKENYHNYQSFFTAATTSYAHGTVVGVIIESKHNYALRGGIDNTSMNNYPLTSNMPTEEYTKQLASKSRMKNLYPLFPMESEENGSITYKESYAYNKGYTDTLGQMSFVLSDDKVSFLKTRYPNRIRSSHISTEGSYRDAWQEFELNSFVDFTSEYGEGLRLSEYVGTLFSFTRNAIFQHYFEVNKAEITEEQILSVGTASMLSKKALRLSDIGLSHKFGITSVDTGVYGVDVNRETLWRLSGESGFGGIRFSVSPLNKTYGINDYMKEYFYAVREHLGLVKDASDATTKINDNLFDGEGVIVAYDRRYNEVLFTFKNKYRDLTICFWDTLNAFTSIYTFTPYFYFNVNRDLYSVVRKGKKEEANLIYRHNNEYSDRLKFYNSFVDNDFMLSIIVSGLQGERSLSMLPKQFQTHRIESQKEPFTQIIHETEYQRAVHDFIEKDEYWSHPEYLSHIWQVPIQIDNTSTVDDWDDFYVDSSMLGNWLKLTLTYQGDNRNKDIFVQSIMTDFYISNS